MRRVVPYAAVVIHLLGASLLLAHQPRIVDSDTVRVHKPHISQAFYGTLPGRPVVFIIDTPDSLDLLVGLMAPLVKGAPQPQLAVQVTTHDTTLFTLSAAPGDWDHFHEFFTWDNYLQGPQRTLPVPPGRYAVTLSGRHQDESYSLVVGRKERFPPREIINTLVLLPRMKRDFFSKSPWLAYFNPFTLMLAVPLALLAGLVYILAR